MVVLYVLMVDRSAIRISQGAHAWLKTNNVPHIWNVDGNAHDTPEWKNNFYWFTQQLFK